MRRISRKKGEEEREHSNGGRQRSRCQEDRWHPHKTPKRVRHGLDTNTSRGLHKPSFGPVEARAPAWGSFRSPCSPRCFLFDQSECLLVVYVQVLTKSGPRALMALSTSSTAKGRRAAWATAGNRIAARPFNLASNSNRLLNRTIDVRFGAINPAPNMLHR